MELPEFRFRVIFGPNILERREYSRLFELMEISDYEEMTEMGNHFIVVFPTIYQAKRFKNRMNSFRFRNIDFWAEILAYCEFPVKTKKLSIFANGENITKIDILRILKSFGRILSIEISSGRASVMLSSPEEAHSASYILNNTRFRNTTIKVECAF